jgi:hypothetical protein
MLLETYVRQRLKDFHRVETSGPESGQSLFLLFASSLFKLFLDLLLETKLKNISVLSIMKGQLNNQPYGY